MYDSKSQSRRAATTSSAQPTKSSSAQVNKGGAPKDAIWAYYRLTYKNNALQGRAKEYIDNIQAAICRCGQTFQNPRCSRLRRHASICIQFDPTGKSMFCIPDLILRFYVLYSTYVYLTS